MTEKPIVMVVLGSGGHTAQMIRLTQVLSPFYDFEYVINDDDNSSAKKIRFPGKIYVIPRPRRVYDKSVLRSICLTFYSIAMSFSVIRNSKAGALVSSGPGLAVPLFIWAVLFKKKRIFVESWSRVTTKSVTGGICYHLSNLFFVQWPDLLEAYPKAIYVGRLG